MPHKNWAVGEEVISPDYNPIIADQIVAVFASAAARASGWPSPPAGAVSILTNDGPPYFVWIFDGTAWKSQQPRGQLAYAEGTGQLGITSGTPQPITGLALAVTIPAGAPSRRVRLAADWMYGSGAAAVTAFGQILNTAGAGTVVNEASATIWGGNNYESLHVERTVTLAPGTTNFVCRGSTQGGQVNVIVDGSHFSWFMAEDVGSA